MQFIGKQIQMEVIKILSDNEGSLSEKWRIFQKWIPWWEIYFIFQMNYLKDKGKILFVVSKIRQIQNYLF